MDNITIAQSDRGRLMRPILRREPPRSRRVGRRVQPGAPQLQVVNVSVIERDRVTGGLMKDRDPVVTLQRLGPPPREVEKGTGSFGYSLFDKGIDAGEAEAEDGDWALDSYPLATRNNVI